MHRNHCSNNTRSAKGIGTIPEPWRLTNVWPLLLLTIICYYFGMFCIAAATWCNAESRADSTKLLNCLEKNKICKFYYRSPKMYGMVYGQ